MEQTIPDAAAIVAERVPVPRSIPFEFPEDLDPHWKADSLEFCAMVNGASLAMPYLEPFLVRTVRETLQQLEDPALLAAGRAFNMQEQHHYRTHRRFNELLKQHGYPELAAIEADMDASYRRLARHTLRARMAYAAGFEAMTLGLTKWLVDNRVRLFGGSDTRVASFVLWHFVEETEHKLVAHDIYRAAFGAGFGGYLARLRGIFHGSFDVMRYSMRGYRAILKKDGLWTDWRSRLRLAVHLGSFLKAVIPYLLRATLPGHDPRRERDPAWVIDWLEGYARSGGQHLPLLDTRDPAMPVPFLAASAASTA